MAIKTRDQLYSGNGSLEFDDPVQDTAPENNHTGGFLTNLKISLTAPIDGLLNRSAWLRTVFYQTHKAFVHKEEDRATLDDLGVTEPSTQTKFVTPEQLPEVTIGINDFAVTTVSGDLATPTSNSLLEVVTTGVGKKKTKTVRFSDIGWKWLKESLKPPTVSSGVSVLVVNSSNNVEGDGSFNNPYQTIDAAVDWVNREVTDQGTFPTWQARRASYTIIVLGGSYTTSKNLSIGVGWYFYPNSTLTYVADVAKPTVKHAWDINEMNHRFPVRVGGYLKFTSSTGGCLRTRVSSTVYEYQAVFEFDSLTSTLVDNTDTPLSLIELEGYNQVHSIKGNSMVNTSSGVFYIGRSDDTDVRGINVQNITGCSYIGFAVNTVQFINTYFFCTTVGSFKFPVANTVRIVGVEFKNCDFGSNINDQVYIIEIGANQHTSSFILVDNVRIKYGASSNKSAISFLKNNAVNTIRLDCARVVKHTDMFIFPSDDTNVTLLNSPAGVVSYTYPFN